MKLICDACAHVYNSPTLEPGDEDGVCSEKSHGHLRELTTAEAILVRRYADLYKLFEERGRIIIQLHSEQGAML